jgi:hypothetical protein
MRPHVRFTVRSRDTQQLLREWAIRNSVGPVRRDHTFGELVCGYSQHCVPLICLSSCRILNANYLQSLPVAVFDRLAALNYL